MQRSFNLSKTEQIVSDIVKNDRVKPAQLDHLMNTSVFQDMRKKLAKLRQKVFRKKPAKLESLNWKYNNTTFSDTKRSYTDNSPVNSPKVGNYSSFEKNKDSYAEKTTGSIPRSVRRIKRVPPPNFMTGMRNLSRVYNENDSSILTSHYRNLSC